MLQVHVIDTVRFTMMVKVTAVVRAVATSTWVEEALTVTLNLTLSHYRGGGRGPILDVHLTPHEDGVEVALSALRSGGGAGEHRG